MKKLLGIVVLLLTLQGCGDMPHNHYFNLKDATNNYHSVAPSINLGDSKSSVMGKFYPLNHKLKSWQMKAPLQYSLDGSNFYVHFQRTRFIEDGNTTDDEFTPYVFANNVLIEIGWVTLQPNTFGQSGQSYSGADATRDIFQALLDIENRRTGVSNQSYGTTTTSTSSFKNEVTSGMSKVCFYNTLSGIKAYNTSANSICPLSYPGP